MNLEEREIRWAPLASSEFIHNFNPSISDVDVINAKLAYVRDRPTDESALARVNTGKIPQLRDIEGDVYVSRAERWLVYHRWLPNYIEVVFVDEDKGGDDTGGTQAA
ncbi:MAG: hypothetical protein ABSG02_03000 [Terriglobales bacterium]|jgi:hypothetical protein